MTVLFKNHCISKHPASNHTRLRLVINMRLKSDGSTFYGFSLFMKSQDYRSIRFYKQRKIVKTAPFD